MNKSVVYFPKDTLYISIVAGKQRVAKFICANNQAVRCNSICSKIIGPEAAGNKFKKNFILNPQFVKGKTDSAVFAGRGKEFGNILLIMHSAA